MYTFICEICGKEFQTKRKAKRHICYDTHYLKCEVCGKEYTVSRADLLAGDYRLTCSKQCKYKLTSASIHTAYVNNGSDIV